MSLHRLRFGLAQLGRKRGADASLAVLLDVADLPGDHWRQLDERTWRSQTGRGVTGWRSFEQPDERRWVWCQATPLPGRDEAAAALAEAPARLLANLGAEVRLVDRREVGPPPVPGAERRWAGEDHTDGPAGPAVTRYLGWTVGSVVSVLAGTTTGEGWCWDDLAGLAAIQTARIGPVT